MPERAHLLLAAIDVDDEVAGDFERWYVEEHIPERAAVPGIDGIRRWGRVGGDLPASLVTYELASATVTAAGAYADLKARGDSAWTRRLRPHFRRVIRGVFELQADLPGTDGPARACAAALTDVDGEDVDAYRAWYDGAHGPLVAAVPGVVRLRRFEREDHPAHLTLVEVAAPDVLRSNAYGAAKAAAPGSDLRSRWRRQQGVYVLRTP